MSQEFAELAALLLPAIRWDQERGFAPHREAIDRALAAGVGGFIFFGGPATEVRGLTRELHARSRIPLLVGADLERGAGQQFDGLTGLPPLAAIASLRDVEAVRHAARITAREARRVGINWDYAPVCDIDVEPDNPIVGTRSLGSEPGIVAELAAEWIDACQREGVLACAKHFPGHGRTTGDSHMELPVVRATADVLYGEDLVPFRAAIDAGVAAIMSAHVAYPALDATRAPATLSRPILHDLLRRQLGFEGLVVTDALIMEGVLADGEATASVRALQAGCDLLLYPEDLAGVLRALERALRDGSLDRERIRRSLERRTTWASWGGSVATDLEEQGDVALERDAWGAEVARRVVHQLSGRPLRLPARTEVVIVDDDLGGPYPAPSREPFLRHLGATREVTVVERPTAGSRGPLVVALFGDIRSWKGRPGYSATAREAVARACAAAREQGRDALVVQFSHPRLAAQLGAVEHLVCAWGGERVMQEAAADVLASV